MTPSPIPLFDRFADDSIRLCRIGEGSIGGKASGLLSVVSIISESASLAGPDTSLDIPKCIVLGTDLFDQFMKENDLYALMSRGNLHDTEIAHAFQRATFPPERVGDIYTVASHLRTPLAVRSSSLLEDSLRRPFAGVYATKMIPNADPDRHKRFQRLGEAIKLVYASTFFSNARQYRRSLGIGEEEEKMAVLLQEVFGRRRSDRFYPCISGVARSFNFYAFAPARPEEGVVNLALGLGKTIVDGDPAYSYSPAHPRSPPPHGSIDELLQCSQTRFWALNLGQPPAHDPVAEAEYLAQSDLTAAEEDQCLEPLASTYDVQSDRLVPGTYKRGPRVLDFAPVLQDEEYPVNECLRVLLQRCEAAVGSPVEVEFAAELGPGRGQVAVGLLQVRPMLVSTAQNEITEEDRSSQRAVVLSDRVLGNGQWTDLQDVVYVKREGFAARHTRTIASEISRINAGLIEKGARYLLLGFGRWGSSDPWLGIPVQWSDISGARAIVEADTAGMSPDFSQGSHFFHNLSSFEVSYFLVRQAATHRIDWEWLDALDSIDETEFVRHVRLNEPLSIKVDGRTGWGVVSR